MSDTHRFLNAIRDKLNGAFVYLLKTPRHRNISSLPWETNLNDNGIKAVASTMSSEIKEFVNTTNLLSQTTDSINVSMRSMNDLIESFNATFQPRSPSNRTGLDLIARAQNILQNMSVSLESISAVLRDTKFFMNQFLREAQNPPKSDRDAFDIANGLYGNPSLVPSLNATIQFERPAHRILDDMTDCLNTTQ